MWHIFTSLQKCSCPLQIVKSRDNSTADELDLHFIKCPEGLQFQNSRKFSRRNSDCSTDSKLHTLILMTADEWPRRSLPSTWWKSISWSHRTSHNTKQNIELNMGINMLESKSSVLHGSEINHIYTLAEAGEAPPEEIINSNYKMKTPGDSGPTFESRHSTQF